MAVTGVDSTNLEVLGRDECWELVRSRSIGRFAANRPSAAPLVVPVNYAVEADSSIVFRSRADTKLDAVGRGLVAIQVDEIDPFHHTGWSVIVEGSARWLYDEPDEVDVEAWAPGARPYVIRLTPTRVTGRRIQLTQPDTDSRGYR